MDSELLRFFHPVCRAGELGHRPIEVAVGGRGYVLFRDAHGNPAALDALCPHRRAPLSMGRVDAAGRIVCPYHGWNFDAHGHGSSPSCPELRHCDTASYQVQERFGHLWMAARDAAPSLFPTLGWSGFRYAGSVTALARAPLDVTLDNISEDEHFPFIHTTFGWDARALAEVQFATVNAQDHSEVRYSGIQRRSPWALLGGVRAGDRFHNAWITRFDPVHAVYTFGWEDPHGGKARPITTRAAVFLVPESDMATRIRMFLFLRIAPSLYSAAWPAMAWLARHISSMELRRDVTLIESVAHAPGDLSGMRLTRFDKAVVHNRKLLRSIYWNAGAAHKVVAIHPSGKSP